MGIMELVVIIFLLLLFIPWLIAFVDILKSDFNGSNKMVWLLAVMFVPLIGAITYFIIGRKQKILSKSKLSDK